MLFLKITCGQQFIFCNTPWFWGNLVLFKVIWDPAPICFKGTVWSKLFNLPSKRNGSCFYCRSGFILTRPWHECCIPFSWGQDHLCFTWTKHLGLDLRQLHFVFDSFYWHLTQGWIWHLALNHCAEGKTKFPALTWNSGGVVAVCA